MEMLEVIDDALSFLFGSVFLALNLKKELLEVRSGHEAVFVGELVEEGLDLRRRLLNGRLEPPPAAEAHAVCVFRHVPMLFSLHSLLSRECVYVYVSARVGSAFKVVVVVWK